MLVFLLLVIIAYFLIGQFAASIVFTICLGGMALYYGLLLLTKISESKWAASLGEKLRKSSFSAQWEALWAWARKSKLNTILVIWGGLALFVALGFAALSIIDLFA